MILLDTNIISELMAANPNERVVNWLNGQDAAVLFLSTITVAEVSYGLRILPEGKRYRILKDKFDQFLTEAFEGRILSFDEAAAIIYGEVMGRRKEMGKPMAVPDGQIAAIARTKGFTLATRNIKDFEHCGISLVNPFSHK